MRSVHAMDDEGLMQHFERFHSADLRQTFQPEPDRAERRLHAPVEWRTFHDTLHRLNPQGYQHDHEEQPMERPTPDKLYPNQVTYGGPTLLEALWEEMDRLMEGLMTGTDAEDGGDRYRAEELAWVLAICTNPMNPSVDAIRKQTMERWTAQQAAAAEEHNNAVLDGVA